MTTGKEWCEKVYKEKLAAPASLPKLGDGYSNEYRAAYAVISIAGRKLYADFPRSMNAPISMPAWSKKFWREVMDCANQLQTKAPPKPTKGFGSHQCDDDCRSNGCSARFTNSSRSEEFMDLMGLGEHVWPFDLTDLAPALWEPAAAGNHQECALIIAEHLQLVLDNEVTLDDDQDVIQAEAFLNQMFAGKVKADVALKMMPADNLNSDFNATMGVRFFR
ncbi:MAG: hypothetical protein WC729_29580 [Sphingomonas sp.]|jgi:hypothetical protein|uniref:hypothetical protein n=1 Tax=Sphingomonas sp. TaxID=28214 RepID=UPI003561C8C5